MKETDQPRVAFVTGACSGIGRATAEAFIRHGYATALVDFNEKAGRDVEEALRQTGECTFISCDVSVDDSVSRAVEQTMKAYGRLDAVFNGAGIDGEAGKLTADCSIENWNRLIATNLTGVWYCMRHQIPAMLESGGGSIVNCASTAGIAGAPFVGAYTATKHGVVGLTRTAAMEYAGMGIRVNAVCPGTIDTPMTQKFMTDELRAAMNARNPTGRFGEPSEIANIVLALCDEGASYLTGQAIAVDGGLTVG